MKRIAVMALAAVAVQASAAIINFTDREQWQIAVDSYHAIRFTSISNGTFLTNQYAHMGVTFDGSDQVITDSGFVTDLKGVEGNGSIWLNFTGSFFAVGADYPGAMRIDLYNGSTLVGSSNNFGGSGSGFFGGVISDVAFNRVELVDWFNTTMYADNVYWASPVPEPATVLLVAGGLAALARRRRR